MTLQQVLAHPAVQPARPLLLAGDPSQREVRWVHSSDISDIAPLLRGGELLLTTGLGLAGAGPQQRRAYVRALADREVAGLALELSRTFAAVPEDMVDEAVALELPFVALQRVHPFVEVAEAINSALLESSITRLRYADEVGRALSLVVAERGGLDRLTVRLAELVRRPVVLTDASEEVLAAAAPDAAAVLAAPAATAVVLSDGVLLGRLHLGEGSSADDLLRAAVDRSPEIFAIEVLRGRSEALLAGRELRHLLVRLLHGAAEAAASLEARAASSGIGPDTGWVGLAVAPVHGQAGLGLVQDAARTSGTRALLAELDGATCALLAVPAAGRDDRLERLREALDRATGPVVALGPVTGPDGAGRSLRAARATLQLAGQGRLGRGRLLLAEDLVVERLLQAVPDAVVLADLVAEQLGGLLDAPHAETLLTTLDCYVRSGCSKAATGRELHLRRQSVHLRLARASAHLGFDVSDPRRLPALSLALAARASTAGVSG